MQHLGTVPLETTRLLLRRFTPLDSEAAYRNWMSDAQVTRFLRWKTHESPATSQEIIQTWVEQYARKDFYQWAIALKQQSGELIGTISVVEQNKQLRLVHIGYCIGSRWWHRGYTSEAFCGLLPFLFDCVGVNRVESQHDPNNPHSGAVMHKCGLRYEGTLRQADFNNCGIVDAAMYSLLADEYRRARDAT